jgi:hypothetical protein
VNQEGASQAGEGGSPSLSIDSGVVGGSTGGGTLADLERGYLPCDHNYGDASGLVAGYSESDDVVVPPGAETQATGFLDRPQGWER